MTNRDAGEPVDVDEKQREQGKGAETYKGCEQQDEYMLYPRPPISRNFLESIEQARQHGHAQDG